LDQSTRNHLSALDAYIKEQAVELQPMQPDEFTVYDYIDKMKDQGVKISMTVASRNMRNLTDEGVISRRKSVKDGKQCNFYRFL
jgi:predicted peroxiredoxin